MFLLTFLKSYCIQCNSSTRSKIQNAFLKMVPSVIDHLSLPRSLIFSIFFYQSILILNRVFCLYSSLIFAHLNHNTPPIHNQKLNLSTLVTAFKLTSQHPPRAAIERSGGLNTPVVLSIGLKLISFLLARPHRDIYHHYPATDL